MGSQIVNETKRSKSPDNESQKERTHAESLPEPDQPEFKFVSGTGNTTYRSHAMKSYWRHKKNEQRRQEDTGHTRSALRPLLSREVRAGDERDSPNQSQFQPAEDSYSYLHDSSTSIKETRSPGIPQQIFSGINFALSSSLSQEAESGSFQISAHHHRYFYHWLSMNAEIIHSGFKSQTFSPFKDIWIPLDLSNAASFNGILAHAAADLNDRRQDEESKSETLKFKTEAIGTINLWLSTPTNEIKDEVFAGVVRLLTFERFWGTRDRFYMHKYGLRQMVHTRGGYQAFHTNWRLQIVVSLLNIVEIEETGQPQLVVRLLQEYESFIFEILGLCHLPYKSSKRFQDFNQLHQAASLKEAINKLQNGRKVEQNTNGNAQSDRSVSQCLRLLLFIWASVKESEKSFYESLGQKDSNILSSLDNFFRESPHIWTGSLNDALSTIWESLSHREEYKNLTLFVTIVARPLVDISPKALWGVEECLLRYWSPEEI